jgi:SlyX protein
MQDRVTELEIKVAHMENDLNVMSDTVVRLQSHVERLELGLERLRDRLDAATDAQPQGNPADEKPPHY